VARRLFDPERIRLHDPAWAAELSARHDPVQGPGAWQRLLPAIAADVADQELYGPVELLRIDAPVLVVAGDRDPFVPVDHAWRLRRQLPDARLFIAPDCGHEVMLRRPALFNEALAGFYRSTEEVATRRAHAGPGAATTPRISAGGSWSSARADALGPSDPDADWLKEASR
jgi:pimeloyl-ACP methyl ester carboxylesterase